MKESPYKYVLFDIPGHIMSVNNSPDISIGNKWLPISNRAVDFIFKNNIQTFSETDEICATPSGMLVLKDEYPEGYYENMRSKYIFRSIIENISKLLISLPQTAPIDSFFTEYMKLIRSSITQLDKQILTSVFEWWRNTDIHTLYQLQGDATALISAARIDVDTIDFQPMFLCASDGYLFDTVKEILVYPHNGQYLAMISQGLNNASFTVIFGYEHKDPELNALREKVQDI